MTTCEFEERLYILLTGTCPTRRKNLLLTPIYCREPKAMVAIERDFFNDEWPFGGKGKPDDVPVPTGEACMKISEILALADEHAGEYSFGGQADMLPGSPGLYIDNLGVLSLPLVKEQADKLIAECEKSPFGHNMETKMDENVRKSWQLQPDQVQMKNPQWEIGIKELSKIIASRLCYKDIPMECKLYKLLVYGEGGHFLKHQDTEKEDGMVATLVVQLPSVHEGGDLVVYRGGEEQHRYDFGKADGTAAFLPHYAVHYADAEHALEPVTKGYRLALVYSVCLPATMRDLERDPNRSIADDLAEAINSMGPDDESFALLLSHEYTKKSIGELGSAALKGIDSARFQALEKANAEAKTDKKLQFFIVKLSHNVNHSLGEEGWSNWCGKQGTHWYFTSGEDLGHNKEEGLMMNFLNPSNETFLQRWNPHKSSDDVLTGNEGPIKVTRYSRFAIIAWPATKYAEYAVRFMPLGVAIEALSSQRPVDAATLRLFLGSESKSLFLRENYSSGNSDNAFLQLIRSLIPLLVEAGDPESVKIFFSNFCPRLGNVSENSTLIPGLIEIIRMCEWKAISTDVWNVLKNWNIMDTLHDARGESGMELKLHIVDGLDDEAAKKDLLQMTIEKYLDLHKSETVELLWKYFIHPGGYQTLKNVGKKLLEKDPKTLGSFVDVFYKHIHEFESNDEAASLVASIAEKRIEWLNEKIQQLDQPFSWEMPDAEFHSFDYDEIEEFLRGPDHSMTTGKWTPFKNLAEAQKLVDTSMASNQIECSYTMEACEDATKAFVKVTKTREWFDISRVKRLTEYRNELERLAKVYHSPSKKARVE